MKNTLLFLFLTSSMFVFSCRQPQAQSNALVSKTASVSASPKVPKIDSGKWLGDWERTDWQAGGGITIKSFQGNRFTFNIQAANGAHTGEIEGKGVLEGDSATFISDEVKGCRIVFKLAGDPKKIMLKTTNECAGYAGAGVYFDGDYLKDPPAKEEEETLVTLNVLENKQDSYMRKLVDSNYQRYVECTQEMDDQDKDLDNLGTKVVKSAVMGSYSTMAYIIMIDKEYHVWTAVINNDTVHYFTNSDHLKNKLPKTIDDWRGGFKDDPVIYHNK